LVLQILTIVVPIFFVLLLGYAAGRAREFDSDQVAGLNELVLDFALPASLFVGTVSTSRTHMLQEGPLFLSRRDWRANFGEHPFPDVGRLCVIVP
jgi:predicted permease